MIRVKRQLTLGNAMLKLEVRTGNVGGQTGKHSLEKKTLIPGNATLKLEVWTGNVGEQTGILARTSQLIIRKRDAEAGGADW